MEEVYSQLFCLLIFTITGIVIGILFDVFRILRKSFKTADIVTYLQDILFWLITVGIILFSIFQFNHGEIRSYVFIGIVLGVVLYMITISKFIIKSSVFIIKWIKKIISYPLHLLENIIKNFIIKPIIFIFNLAKKQGNKIYKKTKNMTKANKKDKKKETNLKEKEGILWKM